MFLGEELVLTKLLYFAGENLLRGGSAVNAAGLDGDEEAATLLQEVFRVESDNSGLIGLGNVGEDDVDHGEQHTVSHGLASIFNDRDDVRAAGLGVQLAIVRKSVVSVIYIPPC